MSRPDKINGLKIWIDAADINTVNNGTVQNNQNVFKIVDKASGFVFRNGYGVNGPSYSYGAVNNKNTITFNYYTTSDFNSIQAKGLWAGGVTPMATGTYSLYCVCFPFDNRKRNTNGAGVGSTQNLWLFSLVNSLPDTLGNYQPNRGLWFRATFGAITDIKNTTPRFVEDTDLVFAPVTNLLDSSNDALLTQIGDRRYIYGKTNIVGVRASNNLKKFSIIRKDYIINENFQPNPIANPLQTFKPTTAQQGFSPQVGGPWLTIGAFIPNGKQRIVEGVAGPIGTPTTTGEFPLDATSPSITSNVYNFEGHFCEFIFYDRNLTDAENRLVTDYLKTKWFSDEPPVA